MVTYIRKNIKGYYIEFPEEIDAEYWAGKIGSTYEDFFDNKWVLLSDEQLAFHNENPNASIKEVLDMQIEQAPVYERTLEQAKEEMLGRIEEYDESPDVNSFIIAVNNNVIHTWIDPATRSNYKNSIDAAELIGVDELHPIFEGQLITIPTQMAKTALAQIQLYADRCFIVTETHKASVLALDSIADVDNYDYTQGYPQKLSFTLD